MPEIKKITTTLEDSDRTAFACQKALSETCKALKAFSFYPENHPLRQQILHAAHQAIASLARSGRVSLIVQRSGFAFADLQVAIDNTPMTRALAQELFARELQRLTFLPELSLAEFSGFLSLLTIAPQKISEAGGVSGMLKKSGIQAIIVNQIDITAVYTKKKTGDFAAEAVADGPCMGEAGEPEMIGSEAGAPDQLSKLSVEELVSAMSSERDDDRYGQIARMLLEKARPLKLAGDFDRLYKVLACIVEQYDDSARSDAGRGYALMALKQLSFGEMTEHLLDRLEAGEAGQKGALYQILTHAGTEATDAVIRRLVAAGSKSSRNSLANILVRIGTPALPALIALLKDGRWQVVHTAVAIVGEMGNRDAVKDLALTVSHGDSRVRMESIRSLARIGGAEATAVLVALLHDKDQAIAVQSITWLGNSRNQMALQPLLQLVMKRDFLGKSQNLKKEALGAIGRIGDRRALNPLFRLVKQRYWIAPGRWDELKLLAIEAIAVLGGESAQVFLEDVSARGGRLGRASQAALESLIQRDEDHG